MAGGRRGGSLFGWLAAVVAMTAVGVLAYQGRPDVVAAGVVGDPPPAVSTSEAMFDPSAVDMAVAILTEPDHGPSGATIRWDKPVVTYSITGGYPDDYLATIHQAFQWVSGVTGVGVAYVAGSTADIEITRVSGTGAFARVWHNEGVIVRATIELGCCDRRAAIEDITQSFGPLGDHGDARSMFSNDMTRQSPSPFDAWVVSALYATAPNTQPDEMRLVLERTHR